MSSLEPQSVLLLEGKDDYEVVSHLLKRHDIKIRLTQQNYKNNVFHICGDVDKLIDELPVRIKNKKQSYIGAVFDADTKLHQRWSSLKNSLKKISGDLVLPDAPDNNGTLINGLTDNSKIGIWVMPNNQDAGYLEDFLIKLIPNQEENPLFLLANEATYLARIYKDAPLEFKDHDKGALHTYMAWQEKPGDPYGTSLHKPLCFSHDTEIALAFLEWFKKLFPQGQSDIYCKE